MIPFGELAEWLRLESNDDYQLVVDLESSVVEAIQNKTDRYFGPKVSFTETLDGTGSDVLHLNETPEATPTPTVSERQSDNTFDAVDAADYELDGAAVYRVDGGIWGRGRRRFRVVYTAGYDPGSEPGPVRQAVKHAVLHFYENRELVAEAGELEKIPKVMDLLQPFRRYKI